MSATPTPTGDDIATAIKGANNAFAQLPKWLPVAIGASDVKLDMSRALYTVVMLGTYLAAVGVFTYKQAKRFEAMQAKILRKGLWDDMPDDATTADKWKRAHLKLGNSGLQISETIAAAIFALVLGLISSIV
jgi:hypothetical protein